MSKEKDFTLGGIAAGLVVWVIFILILIENSSCLESKWNCVSEDLFLAAAMGAIFLIPSYFVARLVSG